MHGRRQKLSTYTVTGAFHIKDYNNRERAKFVHYIVTKLDHVLQIANIVSFIFLS
jgi:hypothetical protein